MNTSGRLACAQARTGIAIDSYREIIGYVGVNDPTTRRIFEDILAQEEEHADDMADLLEDL